MPATLWTLCALWLNLLISESNETIAGFSGFARGC
jgi:hypothetical protein